MDLIKTIVFHLYNFLWIRFWKKLSMVPFDLFFLSSLVRPMIAETIVRMKFCSKNFYKTQLSLVIKCARNLFQNHINIIKCANADSWILNFFVLKLRLAHHKNCWDTLKHFYGKMGQNGIKRSEMFLWKGSKSLVMMWKPKSRKQFDAYSKEYGFKLGMLTSFELNSLRKRRAAYGIGKNNNSHDKEKYHLSNSKFW